MRIHIIMHVPYEDAGCIKTWISDNKHSISYTKIYEDITFPTIDSFDCLIIMGGPMSVYEESEYSWLITEKQFISSAIQNGRKVLGICLGAQLIADVLGSKVYPNAVKEIGWFDISNHRNHEITHSFTDKITVFQWHGDTFDIPENAISLFESQNCKNQAFIFNNQVLALQFHFEATSESINEMLINGINELTPNSTIQSVEDIMQNNFHVSHSNELMYKVLDYLFVM